MQPYFFPYLGHFSLIAACDAWVVFDVSQYTPRTWMNRNRVLHPRSGSAYVTVPLAGASIHMQTRAVRLLDAANARRAVLGALSHYRRHARYYDQVVQLVDDVFREPTPFLVDLNLRSLAAVCRYLELPFHPMRSSALDLQPEPDMGPGDWAPLICSAIGATSYLNPIGGADLFDPSAFAALGIALEFLDAGPFTYPTGPFEFVAGLSILDVLMWNDPAAVRQALTATATIAGAVSNDHDAGAVTCISPR